MRVFVISDIHGNNISFRKALKTVRFKKQDKLIILGDNIDRGPDSKEVLDTIILLKENNFDIICLKGNHEEMLINALNDVNDLNLWLLNGGKETLKSFLTSSIEKIPQKYFNLIKEFKYFYEYENYIFVHAALNTLAKNPYDDYESMLWSRKQDHMIDEKWLGNRIIIHGHNPTSEKVIIESIKNNSNNICIDNGSYINKSNYGKICIFEIKENNLKFI